MELKDILFRIVISLFMGGLFGAERTLKNKPAGFITITLVCTGAALVAMLQLEILNEQIRMISQNPELINIMKADMGRLGAQVISGIGFIGGGAIIYSRGSVQGLTTAAVLWISACLGLAIGYGFIRLAVVAFIGFALILYFMRWIERQYMKSEKTLKANITLAKSGDLDKLFELCKNLTLDSKFRIKELKFIDLESNIVECTFFVGDKAYGEHLKYVFANAEFIQGFDQAI